jgi:multidrug efflux pump subunit AcrA (membrane-fusion protein)
LNPYSDTPDSSAQLAEAQRTSLDQTWRQFGSAGSPEEFCRHWLALQCHSIGDVNDAVVVLQKPGTDTFAPLAFWPANSGDRSHLAEITERALREGRGIVREREIPDGDAPSSGRPDVQLAYPIRLDGRVRGVVALDVIWRDESKLQIAMRELQWGTGWLEVLLRRHADPMEAARLRMKLILQMVAILLEQGSLKNACNALVTEIATHLGCDRVVLGLMHDRELRVEAVSHTVQFDPHANLINATTAAMMESLDQKEPIVYPPESGGRLVVTFAHAELAQLSGAGGVATYPLYYQGQAVGALTLERVTGLAFDRPSLELLDGLSAMLGPLISLQRSRQRSLPAHATDTVRGTWARLVGPGEAGFKFTAMAVSLLLLFLIFAKGEYRVSGEARIEGEIQRALTAPFQGYVRESFHRAGDIVKEGERIARLDDRDLRLERVRYSAQRDQASQQFREAMARRERAAARIASAQTAQAEAQIALIDEQLGRAELVAPFTGILVSGDLSQALGAPVERGQVLFEIAPLDAYRVVIQVDEQQVVDVRPGQNGELVLKSMPGVRYPLTVKTVTPVNVAKEGRNLFRVEAPLGVKPDGRLRPGMEGVAKVYVDQRSLIWIWTREFTTWIKHKLWAWMP